MQSNLIFEKFWEEKKLSISIEIEYVNQSCYISYKVYTIIFCQNVYYVRYEDGHSITDTL